MKRITKDVALYPLRALKTGLVSLWRAFDGLSMQTAIKLFLVGLLVLLYLFWRSYDRKDRYDFQKVGMHARCDKVTGEIYWVYPEAEVQIGVPKSDNQ